MNRDSLSSALDGQEFEELTLEIPISEPGFLFIYVSNENEENVTAYFDDLGVEHTLSPVVLATDYYPFGLPLGGRQHDRAGYRKGYQGEWTENDEETGEVQFEARMYSPILGRFLTVDPARQFASGYVGMGNNPMNGVDPDGRDWWKNGAGGIHWFDHTPDANNWSYVGGADYTFDGATLSPVTIQNNFVADAARGGVAPEWMFIMMDIEFHFDASLGLNAGLLTYSDVGIIGASTDILSVELIKIGLKHDFVNGEGAGGFYGDMMLENGQIKLSHGGRYEAGLDGKYGFKALLDINSPKLSLQEGYIGGGAPLVEIKTVQRHTGVHSIDLGVQEDFSVGAGIGLKGNVNATFQINLSNPARR